MELIQSQVYNNYYSCSHFRNIFPTNLVQACFAHIRTEYKDTIKYNKIKKKILTDDFEALNMSIKDINTTLGLMLNAKVDNITRLNMSDLYNYTEITLKIPYNKTVQYYPFSDGINVLGMVEFDMYFWLGVVLMQIGL